MPYYPYPFRPHPRHETTTGKTFLRNRIETALHHGDPIFLAVVAALLGILLAIL